MRGAVSSSLLFADLYWRTFAAERTVVDLSTVIAIAGHHRTVNVCDAIFDCVVAHEFSAALNVAIVIHLTHLNSRGSLANPQ